MFTILTKDLLADQFRISVNKLAIATGYSTRISYNIARTVKVLDAKLTDAKKEVHALKVKFHKKNAEGNFIVTEDKTGLELMDGVTKGDVEAAFADLGEKVVTVDRNIFTLEDLAPAKLSPADLITLECMIDQQEIAD